MTIWLNADSRILIQGMTGSEGTKHTRRMTASGARVVAGVTPGKAGQDVDGIPVFNDVREAMMATGANVSVVFVPPRFARAAVEVWGSDGQGWMQQQRALEPLLALPSCAADRLRGGTGQPLCGVPGGVLGGGLPLGTAAGRGRWS